MMSEGKLQSIQFFETSSKFSKINDANDLATEEIKENYKSKQSPRQEEPKEVLNLSQNKNIELFLTQSNKYSKESLKFQKEKNVLLSQQQQFENQKEELKIKQSLASQNKTNEEQRQNINNYETDTQVHKLYDMCTHFNRFGQDNNKDQLINHQVPADVISRGVNTIEQSCGIVDDMNEVLESDNITVSRKMNALLSNTKQILALNANTDINQVNQGERNNISSYILSPKESTRTIKKTAQGQTYKLSNLPKKNISDGKSPLSKDKQIVPKQPLQQDTYRLNPSSLMSTQREGMKLSTLRGGINQSVDNLGYAMNLVGKNLESLEEYVKQIKWDTLQILDLSSNHLSVFPMEICKMKNLKRLKLDGNLLKAIPYNIFQELRLESFSLHNNLIKDIPPEICEWKGCLQHLNVSKNHLTTFQKYICYVDSLTSLDVSSNDFMDIPIEMIYLVNLNEFTIDWFKYCLPPRQHTVLGSEGQLLIKDIFTLLCKNHLQGSVNFLDFTTYFSDKKLIELSKQTHANKRSLYNPKKKINFRNDRSFNGLEGSSFDEFEDNQFVLNINVAKLQNSTATSFTESLLPKESEGVQFIPFQNNKMGKKLTNLNINEIQISNLCAFDPFTKPTNQTFLPLLQPLSSQPRRLSRCVSQDGVQPNQEITDQNQTLKNLINFSSESELSCYGEQSINNIDDLSFLQETQNNQLVNSPKDECLIETKYPPFISKDDEVIQNNMFELEVLNLQKQINSEEATLKVVPTTTNENQNDKLNEPQKIVWTQYNQINPKNGRNLLHLVSFKQFNQQNYINQVDSFYYKQAVMEEDISALRNLVNLDSDIVNDLDFDGHNALSLSILEEKYFAAKILIFSKADVNAGGGDFGSCLTIGVIKMQFFLIRDLIRFGADVNQTDRDGNSPLHYLFQQFNRNPEDSAKISRLLLENGANPNLENAERWCPLHFAVRRGCLETVQFVIDYNQTGIMKQNMRKFQLDKPGGQERMTALHIASQMNHEKIVQLLIKANADVFAHKNDYKIPSDLCQKHILTKKLLLLKQSQIVTDQIFGDYQVDQNIINNSFQIYLKKREKVVCQTLEEDENEIDSDEEVQNEEDINEDNDSAEYFPEDGEEEEEGKINVARMSGQKKLNCINISSQPKMIKTREIKENEEQQKPIPQEHICQPDSEQIDLSKQSLDEIEDEDLKGDAPKWFYNEKCQIAYSPNNLKEIQGLNETICQIISKNTILPYDARFRDDKYEQVKNGEFSGEKNKIEAHNYFTNLKTYKQVIKSAKNMGEYRMKIIDQGISLSSRLHFLNELKLMQYKLMQVLQLITRQNIYQLLCRSEVIEDFLKLGDDNLNTLINTTQELSKIILEIYKILSDSPGSDNNQILIQLVNIFGDTCYQLFLLFQINQIPQNTSDKDLFSEKPARSLDNLINEPPSDKQQLSQNSQIFENNLQRDLSSYSEKHYEKFISKDNQKNITEPSFQTYAQRMQNNYRSNILKDFIEFQQYAKISIDTYTQKTLITDQDLNRMMPSEDEYEDENQDLTKIISNYAQINFRSNRLQDIAKPISFI